LTARIKLELIDPRDAVRATAMIEASVPSGSSISTVPLVKIGAGDYDDKELVWYRLRYEITAIDPSGKETDPVSGLISLSEITPDIFRLLVSAPQEVGKEAKYAIRARTLHPLTGEPVPGVNVGARMVYKEDDKERDLKSSGVTNSIGEALLEFKLPGPLKADDVEVKVVARREGFLQEAKEEVGLLHLNQILVSTDKPLYQPDGRWLPRYWSEKEDAKRTALNTAFIARVLAMGKSNEAKADKDSAVALGRALDYLAKRIEEIDEPYLIASYALAAMDAGEKKSAEKAIAKLRTLAREEAGTSYWNLESNTPFYGWGLAGRIETTALAVNALKRDGATGRQGDGEKNNDLMNRGLLFLLRNKDRYGVWLSTQATINVLDTLISLNEGEVARSGAMGGAEIIINGKRVSSVAMPPGGQLSNPITVDLSSSISRGNNRVEIRRSGNATRASAQVVETHYEPWEQGAAERRENIRLRNSSALRLAVSYDKLEAKVGEEIVCNVTAERIGHYGYGMMLAEIGLPPGADVDRESLERAARESDGSLNHYDVLPDRVIAYLWPRAGGVKFSFKFKPRYGVKAQTAPSALYDYYNPGARMVIAPSRVVVK
jgi:hypothetical protein